MTPDTRTAESPEPRTEAARELMEALPLSEWHPINTDIVRDHILAIEAEAAQGAAARCRCGHLAVDHDEDGCMACEVDCDWYTPVEGAAPRAEGSDKNPGHEHVWRCDYCEAVAPRADGLDAFRRLVTFCELELPYWGDIQGQQERWEIYLGLLSEARHAIDALARLAPQERRDSLEIIRDRLVDLRSCNKDDDCHTKADGIELALSDVEYEREIT